MKADSECKGQGGCMGLDLSWGACGGKKVRTESTRILEGIHIINIIYLTIES